MPLSGAGRGWQFSYDTRLYQQGRALQILQADGARRSFARSALRATLFASANPAEGAVRVMRDDINLHYRWRWPDGAPLRSISRIGRPVSIDASSAGLPIVAEQQTITVGAAPVGTGVFTVGGVTVHAVAGESDIQTAARIQSALNTTKPAGVASVSVSGNVVTATFTAAAGNAASSRRSAAGSVNVGVPPPTNTVSSAGASASLLRSSGRSRVR